MYLAYFFFYVCRIFFSSSFTPKELDQLIFINKKLTKIYFYKTKTFSKYITFTYILEILDYFQEIISLKHE